jgi:hypothetical protein
MRGDLMDDIPESQELRNHARQERCIQRLYWRALFDLYLKDRLPTNYIAPHLRSPKADHE